MTSASKPVQQGNSASASVGARTKTEAIARALDAAADLLERGWCQGEYRDREHERYCLNGALMMSANLANYGEYSDMLYAVASYLGIASTIKWNDAPGRTQSEVVAAVRKTAELARSQGTPEENIGGKST